MEIVTLKRPSIFWVELYYIRLPPGTVPVEQCCHGERVEAEGSQDCPEEEHGAVQQDGGGGEEDLGEGGGEQGQHD